MLENLAPMIPDIAAIQPKEDKNEAVAYQIIGADCAVREVFFLKASKEAISEDLRNRYQPDDI